MAGFAIALAAAASVAGCGGSEGVSSSPGASSADGTIVAVGDAPLPGDRVGSLGDAVEVAAGAPGQADAAACDVDRRTLETAATVYETLNGELPTSQDDLVTGQLIKEASPRFEITPDGRIVPGPGSPCT